MFVAYPVQVSGHQLVTVPVSASMYQTVVANLHSGDGQVQVSSQQNDGNSFNILQWIHLKMVWM